jgi:hypothetical protein
MNQDEMREMVSDAGVWWRRQGCVFQGLIAAGLLSGGYMIVASAENPAALTPSQPEAVQMPALLPESAVKQCREYLALAKKDGLIIARPSPNRIDVDELRWAGMLAREKDITLQAVSCDLWQTAMPPPTADGLGERVVVYAAHSGKRLQMLTMVGMSRE